MEPGESLMVLLKKLSLNINILKGMIKTENPVNDYSLNYLLESTVIKVLNIVLDASFENVNTKRKNYAGIDGVDFKNHQVVQISSNIRIDKVRHTISQVITRYADGNFRKLL